jgi:hypothetical protein
MMGRKRKKLAGLSAVTVVVTCLAGCSSAASPGAGTSASASPGAGTSAAVGPAATPQLVTPKPAGGSEGSGSPGKGPQVISNPPRLPGGQASSQKVVLSDRTLTITSVTSRPGPNHGSVLIDLDVVVRDTSGNTIGNKSAFYQLIGAEGDAFGSEDSGSDIFYGTIDAHASRSGTVEFEIPAAAATSLYLLYRPEIATETVLTRLTVG